MSLCDGLISGPGSVDAGLTACSMPGMKLHVKSSRKSGVHNVRKVLGRPPLSRRDVEFPRRDVKLPSLCHVATWIFHVAASF